MSRHSVILRRFAVLLMAFTVVFAYSAAPMSQAYAAVKAKKPAKVTGVKATAAAATSVKVTWKKAKNARKYQVYVSTRKSGGFKKVATTAKRTYTVKKYNGKKLKANTRYYFRIRAVNGKKTGAFSKVITARTRKASASKTYKIGDIVVDPDAKTASFKATVNKSFIDSPKAISHLVLNKAGSMAPNAPFLTDVKALDLYDALIGLGATPWSTSDKTFGSDERGKTLYDVAGDNAAFSLIDITVDGKALADCFRYKKYGTEANAADAVNMAFSGNRANQEAWGTGCVSCSFSCYAGIVSNAAIGMGTANEDENYFFLDNTKLTGGQEVTLVYKVK